jgi:hypothetical protein
VHRNEKKRSIATCESCQLLETWSGIIGIVKGSLLDRVAASWPTELDIASSSVSRTRFLSKWKQAPMKVIEMSFFVCLVSVLVCKGVSCCLVALNKQKAQVEIGRMWHQFELLSWHFLHVFKVIEVSVFV